MLGIPGLAKLGVQYLQSLGYSEAVEVVADADAKKSLSQRDVEILFRNGSFMQFLSTLVSTKNQRNSTEHL